MTTIVKSLYNKETGEIVGNIFTNGVSDFSNISDNFLVYNGHSDKNTHYIQDGILKTRPELKIPTIIKAEINKEIVITSEIYPLKVRIDGKIDIYENQFTISFDNVGIYEVELTPPFPYKLKEIKIEVR